MQILAQPYGKNTLGEILRDALSGKVATFTKFSAAVAFVKRSGVQQIEKELKSFIEAEGQTSFIVGIDQNVTSYEGLRLLLEISGSHNSVFINHDESPFVTFHPKVYFFENSTISIVIIGSGNLTHGGLFMNDESFVILNLDKQNEKDIEIIKSLHDLFATWSDIESPIVKPLSHGLLEQLLDKGYVSVESASGGDRAVPSDSDELYKVENIQEGTKQDKLFGVFKKRPKGKLRKKSKATGKKEQDGTKAKSNYVTHKPGNGFVMTLMKTDVGSGQTTPGTSRRSPEIFIPLSARDANKNFWDWPDAFTEDLSRPGKFDRFEVKMRIGGDLINVNMMTWPVKHDFRLRSEALRSAGEIGDILRMEKTNPSIGYQYYVQIIPQHTTDYELYLSLCDNKTRNSKKVWGYY